MATREPIATDKKLLALAKRIAFRPARSGAVFYHDVEGAHRAALFVRRNAGATRIEDLLLRSDEGVKLLERLGDMPWDEKEEVWWELSRRLARAAHGDAHCFGSERLSRKQPVPTHRSKHQPKAYANTVFEKVELPELENSWRIDTIYYNGKPLT